jgi:hypothetical protein
LNEVRPGNISLFATKNLCKLAVDAESFDSSSSNSPQNTLSLFNKKFAIEQYPLAFDGSFSTALSNHTVVIYTKPKKKKPPCVGGGQTA